jgi:porphobilinogen synthase
MVREVIVTPANFIYPLFIHDETSNVAIASMPGCERHSLASMVAEAKDAYKWGVRSFVVFPKVPDALKTIRGEEAYNPNGIVPRAVSMLKQALPDSIVCTDVALDPYSAAGHDGIVENGKILNDATIEQLCKQSVMQARAGSDVVAPSDMMDGRVGAIRDALDSEGFGGLDPRVYGQVRLGVLRPFPRRPRLAPRLWRQEDVPAGARAAECPLSAC